MVRNNEQAVTMTTDPSQLADRKKAAMDTLMKDAIFNAAVSVLAEHSLNELTMSMVAKAAGVSKGTLYNYYTNKIELLSEVYDRLAHPVRARMEEIGASDMTPPEQISEIVREALLFCDLNKVVLLAFEDSVFEKAKWEERHCFFEEIVASIVEKGVARGDFRPLDPSKAADLLLFFISGVIEKKLAFREQIDIEQDRNDIADLLLNGLMARNGE
jgi:AcrR family transcriptional regulator